MTDQKKDEVLKELHGRLVAAGINPLDPEVQAISEVMSVLRREDARRPAEDAGGSEQDRDVRPKD